MKGPGFRIDLDVRRVWRCPRCGRITRTIGGVTSQRCRCVDDGTWMQLQPPVKREPFRPPPRSPEDREPDEPDDDERLADKPAGVAAVADAVVTTPAPAAELPAETVVEAIVVSTEIVESISVETPSTVDSAAPAAVTEPQPSEPLADGFGAGVVEPLPSASPPNETPSPPA